MDMRSDGLVHFAIFDVYDPVVGTRLADNFTQRRIVNMRYLGEEVMLDLEIKSAYKPGYKPVMGCKISRGHHLVYSPFIFHLIGFYIGHRKRSMFNGMCQLENNADHKSRYCGNDEKTNQPGGKAGDKNRQGNKKKTIQQLKEPEIKMI